MESSLDINTNTSSLDQAHRRTKYAPRDGTQVSVSTILSSTSLGTTPITVVCGTASSFWLLLSSHEIRLYKEPNSVVFTAGKSGQSGLLDGEASQALFSLQPLSGACLDSSGLLVIGDTGNHRIRIADNQNGTVATLAGSSAGCVDGETAVAKFSSPTSIVLTSLGYLMVCDTGNSRIRLVADGMVYSVAGSGEKGFLDGPSLQAQFNAPAGLAVTADGVIIVADTGNHMMRYISDPDVATIAGNGAPGLADGPLGPEALLSSPCRLVWTDNGDLLIIDQGSNSLRLMSTESTLKTLIGGNNIVFAPNSTVTSLNLPSGLDLAEDGKVLLVDLDGLHVAAWKDEQQIAEEMAKLAAAATLAPKPGTIRAPTHLLRKSAKLEALPFIRSNSTTPPAIPSSPSEPKPASSTERPNSTHPVPQSDASSHPTSTEIDKIKSASSELPPAASISHQSSYSTTGESLPNTLLHTQLTSNPEAAMISGLDDSIPGPPEDPAPSLETPSDHTHINLTSNNSTGSINFNTLPLPTLDATSEDSHSGPAVTSSNFITMEISDVYDPAIAEEYARSTAQEEPRTAVQSKPASLSRAPSDIPSTPRSTSNSTTSSPRLGRNAVPSLAIQPRPKSTVIDGNFLSSIVSPEAADIFDNVDVILSTCSDIANRDYAIDLDTVTRLKHTGRQITRNFSLILRRYQDCVQSCSTLTFLDSLIAAVQPTNMNVLMLGPALAAVEAIYTLSSKSPPLALNQLSLLAADIKDGISSLEKVMSSRSEDNGSSAMQLRAAQLATEGLPPPTARVSSMQVPTDIAYTALFSAAELEKSGRVARWAPIRRCCGLFSNPGKGIVWATTTDHLVVKFEESGSMTVLAGLSGVGGYVNGASEKAQFRFLRLCGLVEDLTGGLIIVDSGNHCLRYLNATATRVTTYAGDARRPGFKDGPLDWARFNTPSSIVLSPHGELFISDTGNNRIRMIANGIVSTFGGSGQRGAADGIFLDASFRSPSGLCLSPDGDLYVADYHNHLIRKISGGFVSTVAGDGIEGYVDGDAHTARFSNPTSITMTPHGDLIVSDYYNHCLRLISEDRVSTFAGLPRVSGNKNGFGLEASFTFPNELVVLPAPVKIPDRNAHSDAGNETISLTVPGGSSSPPLSPRNPPGPLSMAAKTLLNAESRAQAAAKRQSAGGPSNPIPSLESELASSAQNSNKSHVRLLIADQNSIRVMSEFSLPKHATKADMGLSLVQMSWEQGNRYQPQQWIIDAITALHATGLVIRDLWTLSSEANLVRPIVEQLLAGATIDWYIIPPRVTATIIKAFCQKLPVPLLTIELQDVFIAASQPIYDTAESRRLDLMQQAIKALPVANRILLRHLITLFAAFGDTQQIPPVWGPILLLRRSLGIFRDAIKASSRVVFMMIEFHSELFSDLELLRHSAPPHWLCLINRSDQVQESFGPYIRSLMTTLDRLAKVKHKVDIRELFSSVMLMRDLLFVLQEQFLNTPVFHAIERYHIDRFHAYMTSFQDAWVKLDDPSLSTATPNVSTGPISSFNNTHSATSSPAQPRTGTFPADSIIAQRLHSAISSSPQSSQARFASTSPGQGPGLPYRTTVTGASSTAVLHQSPSPSRRSPPRSPPRGHLRKDVGSHSDISSSNHLRVAENTLSDSASDSEFDDFLGPVAHESDYERWNRESGKHSTGDAIRKAKTSSSASSTPTMLRPDRSPDRSLRSRSPDHRSPERIPPSSPSSIPRSQTVPHSSSPIFIPNRTTTESPIHNIDSSTNSGTGNAGNDEDSSSLIAPPVEGVPTSLIVPMAAGIPSPTYIHQPIPVSASSSGVCSIASSSPLGMEPTESSDSIPPLKQSMTRAEMEAKEEDNLLASFLRTTRIRNQFDRLVLCALRELVLFAFSVDLAYRGAFFGNPNVTSILDQARSKLDLFGIRQFWKSGLFDAPIVTWRMLRSAMMRYVPEKAPASWMVFLRKTLDNHGANLITAAHFAEFIKAFGPVDRCIENVNAVWEQEWFKGYMTAAEAEHLLCGAAKPSFIVRFRSTHPGSFSLSYSTATDPSNPRAQFDISHVSIDVIREPVYVDEEENDVSSEPSSSRSTRSSSVVSTLEAKSPSHYVTRFVLSPQRTVEKVHASSSTQSVTRSGSTLLNMPRLTEDTLDGRDSIPVHKSLTFGSLVDLVDFWREQQEECGIKMREEAPYNVFEENFCFGEISEKDAEMALELESQGTYLLRLQPRYLIKYKALNGLDMTPNPGASSTYPPTSPSPVPEETDSVTSSNSAASLAPRNTATPGRFWISYIKNQVYAISAASSMPASSNGPEVDHIEIKRGVDGSWIIEGSAFTTLKDLLEKNKSRFVTPYTSLPSISPIMQDDQDDREVVLSTLLQDEEGEDGYYLDIRTALTRPAPKTDESIGALITALHNNRAELDSCDLDRLVDYLSRSQMTHENLDRLLRPKNRKGPTLLSAIRKDFLRTDTVRIEASHLPLNKLCTMSFSLIAGDKPVRWFISDPSSITAFSFFSCTPFEGHLNKGESVTIKVNVVLYKCVAFSKIVRVLTFSPGDDQFVLGMPVFVRVTGDVLASVLREPKSLGSASKKDEPVEEYWKIPPQSLTDTNLLESSLGASVYRAHLHGAIVVQKRFLLRAKVDDPHTVDLKSFEVELAVLLSTRHDNIASFVGAWCDINNNTVFIVLKYAEHGSLAHYLGNQDAAGGAVGSPNSRLYGDATPVPPTSSSLPTGPQLRRGSGKIANRKSIPAFVTSANEHPEETKSFGFKLSLALDAARAVHYMHRQNLLHRDIKSQNLLLDGAYQVQLADFGESRETNTSLMTLGRGTPKYRAPELHTRIYNNKVDIFSLGLVMAELFGAKVVNIPAFVDADKPLLPPMPLGLPAPLLALLKACTLRNPSKRPTAKQVVHVLNMIRKDFVDSGSKRSPRSRYFPKK